MYSNGKNSNIHKDYDIKDKRQNRENKNDINVIKASNKRIYGYFLQDEKFTSIIYENIKQAPCRVSEIGIKGLVKTKPDLIEKEVQSVYSAKNLAEISESLLEIISEIESFDIFSEVQVELMETKNQEYEKCRLEFNFQEKKAVHGKVQTFVHHTEGGLEGYVGYRNLFGRGERFQFSIEHGSQRTTQCSLQILKPKLFGYPISVKKIFIIFYL